VTLGYRGSGLRHAFLDCVCLSLICNTTNKPCEQEARSALVPILISSRFPAFLARRLLLFVSLAFQVEDRSSGARSVRSASGRPHVIGGESEQQRQGGASSS